MGGKLKINPPPRNSLFSLSSNQTEKGPLHSACSRVVQDDTKQLGTAVVESIAV